MKGREVMPGDAVCFVPGGPARRFIRIDPDQHTHAALNMTYRLAYEFDDTGYVLFDEQNLWEPR